MSCAKLVFLMLYAVVYTIFRHQVIFLCQNGQCYFWNWKFTTLSNSSSISGCFLICSNDTESTFLSLLWSSSLYEPVILLWFYCSEKADDSCQILFKESENVLHLYYKHDVIKVMSIVLHSQCEYVNNLCKYVYYCICTYIAYVFLSMQYCI